jgi:catalase
MAHFQQDGHMAMLNPRGRVNFEPNSYTGAERGPREDPDGGFVSFAAEEGGPKRRLRAASFADHYSQAGLFFRSQTAVEQQHIVDAFTFELSKVENPAIRERMVANLRNADEDLAGRIGAGLGMAKLPPASRAAAEPNRSLKPSAKLSILENGPSSFAGRKVGVLVTDGAPAKAVKALAAAVKAEKATLEVIAPTITGVDLDDGSRLPAQQMVGGGPSVLYDAVAVITSDAGAAALAELPAAKDFVTDAHSHKKVIGYVAGAASLFAAAGLGETMDVGYCDIATPAGAKQFVASCRALRVWERP